MFAWTTNSMAWKIHVSCTTRGITRVVSATRGITRVDITRVTITCVWLTHSYNTYLGHTHNWLLTTTTVKGASVRINLHQIVNGTFAHFNILLLQSLNDKWNGGVSQRKQWNNSTPSLSWQTWHHLASLLMPYTPETWIRLFPRSLVQYN